MSDFFTTKDIDKLRKALKKAGAKPLKIKKGATIELYPEEWEAMKKMDKWATKTLNEAGIEMEDIIK